MVQLKNGNQVITPTEADSEAAKVSGERLAALLGDCEGARLHMRSGGRIEEIALPPSALRLLASVLVELGQGNTVTVTPIRAELTTRQAADLLNVSRPHLVKLLDEKVIPSRKVGSHRRVLVTDLLRYRNEFEADRNEALDELSALSQELGLGY